MLRYEMKKMLYGKWVIIVLTVVFLYVIASIALSIHGVGWLSSNGKSMTGLRAVQAMRKAKMPLTGQLTTSKIADVIKQVNAIENSKAYKNAQGTLSDSAYAKVQQYGDIRDLINKSYSGLQNYDYYKINSLTPNQADGFYDRVAKLKVWLHKPEVKNLYNAQEKAFFEARYQTLKAPIQYTSMDGWKKLMDMSQKLFFVLAVCVSVIVPMGFSIERQTGSEAIYYSSVSGRTKGTKAKIIATIFTITVIYWVAVLIMTFALLLFYGSGGGNSPIQAQANFWYALYPFTNLEAYALLCLMGYLGCLTFGLLSGLFAALTRNAMISIVITFLLIMLPAFIGQSVSSPGGQKIVELFPSQLLQGNYMFGVFTVYDFGKKVVNPFVVLIALWLFACIILVPSTYWAFRKRKA